MKTQTYGFMLYTTDMATGEDVSEGEIKRMWERAAQQLKQTGLETGEVERCTLEKINDKNNDTKFHGVVHYRAEQPDWDTRKEIGNILRPMMSVETKVE